MWANGFEAAIVILIAVVVGIFYGGQTYGTAIMRNEAVDRGYAQYCPSSGDFAWLGECDKSN